MTNTVHHFGIIGLGAMGGNLALQALEKGYQVSGFRRSEIDEHFLKAGLKKAESVEDLINQLPQPRLIFLYIPAGPVVDKVIESIVPHLDEGDVIADGGNSYWGDSLRRHQDLKEKDLHFLDVGTSGGVSGARNGACFMIGGEKEAVNLVEPLLKMLSVEGGYVHAGPPASGHFVKLAHNGIEFGMLQAIGEGMDLLSHFKGDLDMEQILHCWNNGSVIRSWLVELMEQTYKENKGMQDIPAYVEDTGEVNWLVNDAMRMEVPVPVIAQSVMQLFTSRDDDKNWAKAIAMMRHGFGGHPYGSSEAIVKERRTGKVGKFPEKMLDAE